MPRLLNEEIHTNIWIEKDEQIFIERSEAENANEAELSWLAFSCFSKLTAVRLQGEFSCANKSWQGLFFPFHPQKSFNQYGRKAAASAEHNKAACLFSKSKGRTSLLSKSDRKHTALWPLHSLRALKEGGTVHLWASIGKCEYRQRVWSNALRNDAFNAVYGGSAPGFERGLGWYHEKGYLGR